MIQPMVVQTAEICYSERIQNKISRGKDMQLQVEGNLGVSLESSPLESHRMCFILVATNHDEIRNKLSTSKACQDSVSKVFIGSWSCRHPLPGKYQNLELPKRKQFFLFVQTLGHFCQAVPKPKFPETAQRPTV